MHIKSTLRDGKVSANSVMIEIKVSDYLGLAKSIFKSNEFQRKKVRGSKSIYSLLKADIISGCVMPPVVLAYRKPVGTLEVDLNRAITEDAESFVLLDGLQRSHTLMEVETETIDQPEVHERFLNSIIRCEIYEGINRLGILYRMLTLNTGQTAMSLRHQIEIMYLDFLDTDIEGVKLLREVDGARARQLSGYNFRDVIEGFNSYLERSESPLDRGDILDNIASLENLAKENSNQDLFREFVLAWDKFVRKVNDFNIVLPNDDDLREDDPESDGKPSKTVWANTGLQAFKRAQAISGFGAAIGMLRDGGDVSSFVDLPIEGLEVGTDEEDFIIAMNESIQNLNKRSKRIGNAQRLFFRQFFKMLFWRESGSYLNLHKSQEEAFKSALKIGI
ncbi:DUF262 domain-containing protein [Pseudomonas sp. IT-P12]|uniref:hypothetical protein n=1 Tax=Pseudomonas sp. IT-P12 TaxID=3026450 RepID=UPI0039E19A14